MDLVVNISGTNGNIQISLSPKSAGDIEDSSGSLVFPFYNDNFVMTFHMKRKGWEFPAGTREEGETPLECAKRESFEEAGAILKNVKALGYYTVNNGDKKLKYAIYKAEIDRFEPKPSWSETDLVKLFTELPEDISYQDDVYKIVLNHIKSTEGKM
ncbi:NUDIX domain-containing protein [Sporosalibacterium faouarense]|uniref:NUDIX domain-containing protein n=1 Tax=Sporosalibacterium faouarense TaxID=516123 RepID=UPI00192C5269|nr:NUDIX domain-containing protein [Sporosalibacterium faouarense]